MTIVGGKSGQDGGGGDPYASRYKVIELVPVEVTLGGVGVVNVVVTVIEYVPKSLDWQLDVHT